MSQLEGQLHSLGDAGRGYGQPPAIEGYESEFRELQRLLPLIWLTKGNP